MGEAFEYYHKGLINEASQPNSLRSLLENYQGGAEYDLILLNDGNIVVMHPSDFGLEIKQVEQMDLNAVEILGLTSPKRNDVIPPLLSEQIGLASDTDTTLILEIKASTPEKARELAQKAVRQIREMDKEGSFGKNNTYPNRKINFESFSASSLQTVYDETRDTELNFVTTLSWPVNHEHAQKTSNFDLDQLDKYLATSNLSWEEIGLQISVDNKINQIEYNQDKITKELVDKAHTMGIKIGTSQVKTKERKDELNTWGIDFIEI